MAFTFLSYFFMKNFLRPKAREARCKVWLCSQKRGDDGGRTHDLHNAIVALYQLSYVPLLLTNSQSLEEVSHPLGFVNLTTQCNNTVISMVYSFSSCRFDKIPPCSSKLMKLRLKPAIPYLSMLSRYSHRKIFPTCDARQPKIT